MLELELHGKFLKYDKELELSCFIQADWEREQWLCV